MPIKKGTTSIGSIYKGTTPIGAIYKGTKLIFESAKWLPYNYEYLYYDLIPTTINSKNVQNKAKVSKIYANGVIENQLVEYDNPYGSVNCSLSGSGTNEISVSITDTTASYVCSVKPANNINASHKLLIVYYVKPSRNISFASYLLDPTLFNLKANEWNAVAWVGQNNNVRVHTLRFSNTQSGDTAIVKYNYIDLTLMFGTGNEPITLSDNRIQALLNRGYIDYNTGSYKSTDMIEFTFSNSICYDNDFTNLGYLVGIDGNLATNVNYNATDYIEVKPNTIYKWNRKNNFSGGSTVCRLAEYNSNKTMITYVENSLSDVGEQTITFTTNGNTKYIRLSMRYTDTNVYVAPNNYIFNTLPFKYQGNGAIDAHDSLEITDTEWVFTKNVGSVDLGSLNWIQDGNNFRAQLTTIKTTATTIPVNAMCKNYVSVPVDASFVNYNFGCSTTQNLYFRNNNYSTASDFATAMSGVPLYYELNTPQVVRIPRKHLGIVDLGSLTWIYESGATRFYAYVGSNFKGSANNELTNMYCEKYLTDIQAHSNNTSYNNIIMGLTSGYIYVRDNSYSSAADLKSALSGIYLFYETESEVADIANKLNIEPGGTLSTTNFEWIRNQQLVNGDFYTNTDWTATNCTYDFGILTASSNNTNPQGTNIIQSVSYTTGHKYFTTITVKTDYQTLGPVFGSIYHIMTTAKIEENTVTTLSNIFTATIDNDFRINMGRVSSGNRMWVWNCMLIDLTLAFGAGNEPTDTNDSRIQAIIRNGYIPTDTTGTSVGSNVLQNIDMLFKCK